MRVAFALALFLTACGPKEEASPSPPARPAEAEPEAAAEEPNFDEAEEEAEEAPLPALGERELDAMDAPALEAACFGGSTAACDRLGH